MIGGSASGDGVQEEVVHNGYHFLWLLLNFQCYSSM